MEKELQNKLETRNIVLFFGASWCAPCKRHRPECERISREHGFEFEYVSIHDDNENNYENIIEHFNISTVPYMYASYQGTVLHFPCGFLEDNLKSLMASIVSEYQF